MWYGKGRTSGALLPMVNQASEEGVPLRTNSDRGSPPTQCRCSGMRSGSGVGTGASASRAVLATSSTTTRPRERLRWHRLSLGNGYRTPLKLGRLGHIDPRRQLRRVESRGRSPRNLRSSGIQGKEAPAVSPPRLPAESGTRPCRNDQRRRRCARGRQEEEADATDGRVEIPQEAFLAVLGPRDGCPRLGASPFESPRPWRIGR